MRCPRDQTDLTARVYEASVEVDECPSCKGYFLDAGELEAIREAMDTRDGAARPHAPPAPEAARKIDLESLVTCPKCEALMTRRRHGLGADVVIDECPDGCGIWLDGGELEALEAFYDKGHAEAKVPVTWRLWSAVGGKTKKA